MVSVNLEQVIFGESLIAGLLIFSLIFTSLYYPGIFTSEGARIRLRQNLGRFKATVLVSLASLYLYLLGETIVVAVSLEMLPSSLKELHEWAEIGHLTLLIIGFSMGMNILQDMKEEAM